MKVKSIWLLTIIIVTEIIRVGIAKKVDDFEIIDDDKPDS